tara:strand:+ start:514 stop:666 length:153 start_codon:yes stop_codon:yes gene_type:complete
VHLCHHRATAANSPQIAPAILGVFSVTGLLLNQAGIFGEGARPAPPRPLP